MSRIDVQTLVLAFEKRIEMLEKNPPDKVPMSVVINLLEKSIDEVIRGHFVEMAKKDVEELVKKELKNVHAEFVRKTVSNILSNEIFRDQIEHKFKSAILESIKNMNIHRDNDDY